MALAMVEGSITYTVEPDARMIDFYSDQPQTPDRLQVEALLAKHHDEIVKHKHLQKLDGDWKRYRELIYQNRIFTVFAREGSTIVGYIVVFVLRHLHDKTLVYSMDDLYYIEPSARGASIGAGMIAAAEKEARRRGSKLMTLRAKVGTPAHAFLHKIGYHDFEMVCAKEL